MGVWPTRLPSRTRAYLWGCNCKLLVHSDAPYTVYMFPRSSGSLITYMIHRVVLQKEEKATYRQTIPVEGIPPRAIPNWREKKWKKRYLVLVGERKRHKLPTAITNAIAANPPGPPSRPPNVTPRKPCYCAHGVDKSHKR